MPNPIINRRLILGNNQMYVPFLDVYGGSVAAYSVFKLRSAYMDSCIRVRRDSDNAEQDIGFMSNYLDITSLLSFTGASNAKIVTIYDQSGSGNNLTHATAANQPLIVSTGVLNTVNSIASILFDGINDYLDLTVPISNNNLFSSVSVIKRDSVGTVAIALQNSTLAGGGCYTPFIFSDNKIYLRSDSGFDATNGTVSGAIHQCLSGTVNGATKKIFRNNVQLASTNTVSATSSQFNALGRFNNTVYGKGNFQEMIFYPTDQTANLSAMNANRMAAFGIV